MTDDLFAGPPWRTASKIETFELCPRKWAWASIEGLKRKDTESSALGDAIHGQLEAWLREGRALDLTTPAGQIALSGVHLLPKPRTPGLDVEAWYGLQVGGHRFRGKKDWQRLGLPVPEVGDHKSTKKTLYVKSADDLRTDVQAALYAADAMHRTGAHACDLVWVYYLTKGPRRAKRVHLRVTRDDVRPVLARAVAVADAMAAAEAKNLRALDLPPNPNACDAFGGCDFKEQCGEFSPAERIEGLMAQGDVNDWIAKMQARAAGAPAPAINPPPVAPPPAPVEGPPGWMRGPDGGWIPVTPPAATAPLPGFVVAKRGRKSPPAATAPAPSPSPAEHDAAIGTAAASFAALAVLADALEAAAKAIRGGLAS